MVRNVPDLDLVDFFYLFYFSHLKKKKEAKREEREKERKRKEFLLLSMTRARECSSTIFVSPFELKKK